MKSKNYKLELHFRPEDPYSHPAFGALRPCNNFLLKISKKKSCDSKSTEPSSKILKNSLSDASNVENSEETGHSESEPVASAEELDVQRKTMQIFLLILFVGPQRLITLMVRNYLFAITLMLKFFIYTHHFLKFKLTFPCFYT